MGSAWRGSGQDISQESQGGVGRSGAKEIFTLVNLGQSYTRILIEFYQKKNCKIPHFLPILSNVAVCCCKLTQFTSIMSHAVLRESRKTVRGGRVLLHMWGSQREEQYQIIQESLHSTKIAPRIFTTWTWSQSPPAPCWRESFKWTSWNESGLMFHAPVCLGPVMGILISKVKNGWVTVVIVERSDCLISKHWAGLVFMTSDPSGETVNKIHPELVTGDEQHNNSRAQKQNYQQHQPQWSGWHVLTPIHRLPT